MIRFALLLSLVVAVPAAAQDADPGIGKRVGKLESEMRAVQRKVFTGGDARYFEPEVAPAAPVVDAVGTPASAPLTDLTARVGELEAQLRTLTGQVEASENRLRLLEEGLTKFRGDAEFRLTALEGGAKPAPTDAVPPPADAAPVPPAAVPLTVEGQWRAAYAFVAAKDYPAAETALTEFLARNPKAARASDAQYWLGRTFSAGKQYAPAAQAFLDGYKKYPKGARGPDSLLGLAQALIDLKKPAQACQSLSELDAVYGAKLTPALKAAAAKARTTAKCAA